MGKGRGARIGQKGGRYVGALGSAALALLVVSGQLKSSVLFNWIPGDLTLICSGLVALFVVVSRVRTGPASRYILVPITLWLIFLLPMLYAPSAFDSLKVLTLFTVTLLIAIAPFYLMRTTEQLRTFLVATTLLAMLAALIVVTSGSTVVGFESRFVLEGSDTIGTARVAGAGAIVAILFALTHRTRAVARVLLGVAGIGLLVLAFASGSRGPVVAATVALLAVAVLSSAFKAYRIRVLVAILIVGIIAVAIATARSEEGIDRVFDLLGGGDASSAARGILTADALAVVGQNPFGIGWGNFIGGNGMFNYPHNLFVEVPMEAGWFAGVFFILVVIGAAARYLLLQRHPHYVILLALLIFSVLNAAVSSDVNGNRLFWVVVFAAFAVRTRPKRTSGVRRTTRKLDRVELMTVVRGRETRRVSPVRSSANRASE